MSELLVYPSNALTAYEDRQEAGTLPCQQVDPDFFFPEKGESSGPAIKMCNGCDVREECLMGAVERDERFGVWGGMGQADFKRYKRRVKKSRQLAAVALAESAPESELESE